MMEHFEARKGSNRSPLTGGNGEQNVAHSHVDPPVPYPTKADCQGPALCRLLSHSVATFVAIAVQRHRLRGEGVVEVGVSNDQAEAIALIYCMAHPAPSFEVVRLAVGSRLPV